MELLIEVFPQVRATVVVFVDELREIGSGTKGFAFAGEN